MFVCPHTTFPPPSVNARISPILRVQSVVCRSSSFHLFLIFFVDCLLLRFTFVIVYDFYLVIAGLQVFKGVTVFI